MMITLLAPLLAFHLLSPDSPVRTETTAGPREDVLATVQRLFDAMRTKDTTLLRSVFAPGARLVGMRPRNGASVMQVLTVDQFADFVARDQRGPWVERAWNPEVKIEGTLATVWAEYDFHLGGAFSHCGVDAVQLLQTADGWKIVSLADTYQPEGCAKRPGVGE